MSVWSTASTTLAIAIIAICCVFAVPLFANRRSSNDGSRISGIFLYILGSCFLLYETKIYIRLKLLFPIKWGLNLVQRFNAFDLADHRLTGLEFEHNYLSYFFFSGYCLSQLWNVVNLIVFAINRPECCSKLCLFTDLAKWFYGFLLILAINIKGAAQKNKVSLLVWSVVGALCFSAAFKYVVEEVVWGYIDIVEKSILYPEYGLNITNGTTAVEYVEELFKRNTKCFEHVVLREVAEYILELIPFSTEYFSLATFFCVVSWKNAGSELSSELHDHLPEPKPKPIEPQNNHSCSEVGFFSLNKWWALGISVTLILCTCLSIAYFYMLMEHHNYFGGTWIFIGQQLVFQVILVLAEGIFYFRYMRRMNYTPNPPRHFQLDAMMLVFPLFPLGVLFVLRVFPDLLQLNDAHSNHMISSEPLWAMVNVFLAVFNYCQVAFQAVFISEVFCRLEFGGLRKSGYFFMVLASLNFCVWLSWTLECKLVTIHGRSYEIYGVVSWIIVVYATVPFVMFCFAHSTACFIEIMTHCLRDHVDPENRQEREGLLENVPHELESGSGSGPGIPILSNPNSLIWNPNV